MSAPHENFSAEELERLRTAFRADSRSSVPEHDPEDGPDPGEIWDAVAGELDAERVQELVEQMSTDAGLAEEWRMARDMQTEVSSFPSGELLMVKAPTGSEAKPEAKAEGTVIAAAHRFRRVAGPIIGLAVAAMLLIVVGLPKKDAPPAQYRAGEGQQIESLIPRGEALPRDAFVLRWSEIDGAVYSLLVSGADLQVIDQPSELTSASYQVPATSLEGVEGEVYWQVEASLPDGSSLTSKTFVQLVIDQQ